MGSRRQSPFAGDIDHLGNRPGRAVGGQYRIGLVRMERAVKERMSMSQGIKALMPHGQLPKPVSAVVKETGSSQLSQFMDQTNPLVKSHKTPFVGPWTRWIDP